LSADGATAAGFGLALALGLFVCPGLRPRFLAAATGAGISAGGGLIGSGFWVVSAAGFFSDGLGAGLVAGLSDIVIIPLS